MGLARENFDLTSTGESSSKLYEEEEVQFRLSIEGRLTALESMRTDEAKVRELLGPISDRVSTIEGKLSTAKTAILIVVPLVAAAISAAAITAAALISRS